MLRDLMCESASMDVYCYVFGGSVWNASSATWSNCNPDGYTTLLTTKTLSYSTGNALNPKHYYAFDISDAVQGWIDGNCDQNKGILFKASSAVENGTATTNRTFGSYNRSSNKPSLSVTYTEYGTQYIENDTYYLNNHSTGKYLQKNSATSVVGASGLISSLLDTIRWDIQKVAGGYVLRSHSDNTKYLGVTSSASGSGVTIVTVSNAVIPGNCIWDISSAVGGGCLIRSTHNSCYLYSMGNYLYTMASTGNLYSSTYIACTWRFVSTSDYGGVIGYTYRELDNSFSVSNMILNLDNTGTPVLTVPLSNALWADFEDFTFSYSSGTNCVTVTESTGSISADDLGIAVCQATHKVTNRSYIFKVYVDRFTYELTNEFKFEDDDAVLIRNHYEKVDAAYTDKSAYEKAWYASRSLSIFTYLQLYKEFAGIRIDLWDAVGGYLEKPADILHYYLSTLDYSYDEYAQLKEAIEYQNKNALALSAGDFAHFSYSLAARLAYYIGKDVYFVLDDIQVIGEDASYIGGWLGDAVVKLNSATTTSFKNDDYHSDLDAENVYRLMLTGKTLTEAVNQYYPSLTTETTRADIFRRYISYSTVEAKVTTYASLLWMFSDDNLLLEDIRDSNPETYNFLESLYFSQSDIGDYA